MIYLIWTMSHHFTESATFRDIGGSPLRPHDVIPLPAHAPQGPAGVDDELRVVGDHLPVVGGVVGRDEHAVVTDQRLAAQRHALHLQVVVPHAVGRRDVRVVVVDLRAQVLQFLDQLETRALADVVHESPSFELIEKLEHLGAEVDYNDPHVPSTHRMRHYDLQMKSVALSRESLVGYDCVLVAAHHAAYDWQMIADHAKLIVDTRGALRGVSGKRDHIVGA